MNMSGGIDEREFKLKVTDSIYLLPYQSYRMDILSCLGARRENEQLEGFECVDTLKYNYTRGNQSLAIHDESTGETIMNHEYVLFGIRCERCVG